MDVDAEGKAWLQPNGLISDKDRLRNIDIDISGKARLLRLQLVPFKSVFSDRKELE